MGPDTQKIKARTVALRGDGYGLFEALKIAKREDRAHRINRVRVVAQRREESWMLLEILDLLKELNEK